MSEAPPPAESRPDERTYYDLDRTTAFSDGVFAIAITLIVLTIEVPNVADEHLRELPEELADTAPQLLTYFVTFLVMGRFWLLHHRLFGDLVGIDGRLSVINLAYLSLIAVFPFTAELLSSYGSQPSAVAVYAVGVGLVAAFDSLMTWYALNNALIDPEAREETRDGLRVGGMISIVFFVSAPIAFLSTTAAFCTWAVTVLFGVGRRAAGRLAK